MAAMTLGENQQFVFPDGPRMSKLFCVNTGKVSAKLREICGKLRPIWQKRKWILKTDWNVFSGDIIFHKSCKTFLVEKINRLNSQFC